MINQFRIQNFKALRDVTLELNQLQVLIGPNDSGKSSILEAVAAFCRTVDHPLSTAFSGRWEGRSLVWRGSSDAAVSFEAHVAGDVGEFSYGLGCRFATSGRNPVITAEWFSAPGQAMVEFGSKNHAESLVFRTTRTSRATESNDQHRAIEQIHAALLGAHLCRWHPALLALPVAPDSKRRFRMEPTGFGLAMCLDDILGYDRQRFIELEQRFTEIFPGVRSIRLQQEPAYRAPPDDPNGVPMLSPSEGKGIYFELNGPGAPIAASQASDGTLLVLAYLTLLHLPEPPRMILVEEPENGIHPRRLEKIIQILRSVVATQSRSQMLITTHSPYVVDQFLPEEVTLCQKAADGSVNLRRLSESAMVRDQMDLFTLGEIWTAEGDDALAAPAPSAGMAP